MKPKAKLTRRFVKHDMADIFATLPAKTINIFNRVANDAWHNTSKKSDRRMLISIPTYFYLRNKILASTMPRESNRSAA